MDVVKYANLKIVYGFAYAAKPYFSCCFHPTIVGPGRILGLRPSRVLSHTNINLPDLIDIQIRNKLACFRLVFPKVVVLKDMNCMRCRLDGSPTILRFVFRRNWNKVDRGTVSSVGHRV